VNLFLDRAQSVVSDFSLAQLGEADAVVEICRRRHLAAPAPAEPLGAAAEI